MADAHTLIEGVRTRNTDITSNYEDLYFEIVSTENANKANKAKEANQAAKPVIAALSKNRKQLADQNQKKPSIEDLRAALKLNLK